MRLDFFVAHATGLSRNEAKQLIKQGAIRVAGEVQRRANHRLAAGQQVYQDETPLSLPDERYLMLNKPAGTVSSRSDDGGPSVLQLLPSGWRDELHIVGRLDADTTGLLLLSSDGQWLHRITSPRSDCSKTYWVTCARPLTDAMLQQLRQGVLLRGEKHVTRPARVEGVSERQLRLRISEGRYHQVKRMLAAVGNHVVALQRTQIGELRLDAALAPGQYRSLRDEEVALF